MICHQTERTARAMLATFSGYVVDADGNWIQGGSEFFLIGSSEGLPGYVSDGGTGVLTDGDGIPLSGGLQFRFYVGESDENVLRPCAKIVCNSGDGEIETGNELVDLAVTIEVPLVKVSVDNDPLNVALELSEAMYNLLMRDDVCQYLNKYREDASRLSILGVSSRSTAKTVEGEHVVHQINLGLYCAACDLQPELPVEA